MQIKYTKRYTRERTGGSQFIPACHAFPVNCASRVVSRKSYTQDPEKAPREFRDPVEVREVEASVALITPCIICERKILLAADAATKN